MKLFEVSRNDRCLCGSNLKYKCCCMDKLSDDIFLKKTDEAIRGQKYEDAYILCNADITKHIICMKRHIDTFLTIDTEFFNDLFENDLILLNQIFSKLSYILICSHMKIDIDDKFSRIENLIDDKNFYELVCYYRVMLICILENNSEKAKKILLDLDSGKIEKVELLEYYRELVGPFSFI